MKQKQLMLNMKMLQQRVLMKPIEEEQQTGQLFIPDNIAKNIATGVIVAIGDSKLRVGDRVYYDPRQSSSLRLEGEDYLLVHETQIFAILGNS